MTPRAARTSSPPPVSFLLGDDYYAKRIYLDSLSGRLGAGGMFSREYFLASEASPADILDAVRTSSLDFFAALDPAGRRRLVVVEAAERFTPAQWKLMKEYFDHPSGDVFLVFLIDRLKKDWAPARWVPGVLECRKLKGAKLLQWLREESSRRKIPLTDKALRRLIEAGGDDRFLLAGELEKLSVYHVGGGSIDEDEVLAAAGKSREADVFSLGKLVFSGKSREALKTLDSLLEAGENPVGILAVLTRHFRRLQRAREVLERTGDAEAACRAAGVFYFQEEFIPQARALRPRTVKTAYRELLNADALLKDSGASERLALERAVIAISRGPDVSGP